MVQGNKILYIDSTVYGTTNIDSILKYLYSIVSVARFRNSEKKLLPAQIIPIDTKCKSINSCYFCFNFYILMGIYGRFYI